MSEATEVLRSKLNSANELKSVVRTMKALAAANIGQYERALRSLSDYYRTVRLAMAACFRTSKLELLLGEPEPESAIGAVVFGSDLGLVGRFNEYLAEYLVGQLPSLPVKRTLWVVGERMGSRLEGAGWIPMKLFALPNSVSLISPLIMQLLEEIELLREKGGAEGIFVFHNRPISGAGYEQVHSRLLPLDQHAINEWSQIPWPTPMTPEVLAPGEATLQSLIREYLFVSLFQACAESLASENASRLASMQRAERNIGDLVEDLTRAFNQTRQTSIDEELFDLLGGFEALSQQTSRKPGRQKRI